MELLIAALREGRVLEEIRLDAALEYQRRGSCSLASQIQSRVLFEKSDGPLNHAFRSPLCTTLLRGQHARGKLSLQRAKCPKLSKPCQNDEQHARHLVHQKQVWFAWLF